VQHSDKRQNTQKQKGHDFFAGMKGMSKNHQKLNVHNFGKKQNWPKGQKWQVAPAMGAIREA